MAAVLVPGAVASAGGEAEVVSGEIAPPFRCQRSSSQRVALYPYEDVCVAEIRAAFRRGARKVLFVLPTGGGKTVIFCFIAEQARHLGHRILILVHRQELIEQTVAALSRFGIECGIIAAGYEPRGDLSVQVASVMTLVRREVDGFDLVVVDEAHHAVAGSWRGILDKLATARILGTSATPERLDGRGLGDIFDEMVVGPSTAELTHLRYLAPAVVYAPTEAPDLSDIDVVAGDYDNRQLEERMMAPVLVGDVVEQYRRRAEGVPAIAFCVGIRHSNAVCEKFSTAGYRAVHVDGTTPDDERRAAMAALAKGELDVVSNCALIAEGFDAPVVGALLSLRPTQSLALHLQMLGRALRTAPGKEKAVVLDHAGNVYRHGLPTQDRLWSLSASRRLHSTKASRSPVKVCPTCRVVLLPGATECPECGHEFGREIATLEGELAAIRMDPVDLRGMSYRSAVLWAGRNRERLRRVQLARGYKPGWVHYQMLEPRTWSP